MGLFPELEGVTVSPSLGLSRTGDTHTVQSSPPGTRPRPSLRGRARDGLHPPSLPRDHSQAPPAPTGMCLLTKGTNCKASENEQTLTSPLLVGFLPESWAGTMHNPVLPEEEAKEQSHTAHIQCGGGQRPQKVCLRQPVRVASLGEGSVQMQSREGPQSEVILN